MCDEPLGLGRRIGARTARSAHLPCPAGHPASFRWGTCGDEVFRSRQFLTNVATKLNEKRYGAVPVGKLVCESLSGTSHSQPLQ